LLNPLIGPTVAEIQLAQRFGKHARQALVAAHQIGMRLRKRGKARFGYGQRVAVAKRREQYVQHDAL
jgi:hypothetical protein